MSNWCTNKIKIETEDNALTRRIGEEMKSDLFCFDFNKLIPIPNDALDCREWMQKNWGTSNLYSAEYYGDGEWHVTTANCPPYKVLEELSRKYGCKVVDEFSIEIEMGAGRVAFENGRLIREECFE